MKKKLPQGVKTFLSAPNITDMSEFLDATKNSTELHHPWVQPPSDELQYKKYLKRINCTSHIGFLIKHIESKEIIGVININEIVMGVFQSGYLGFYAFQKYSGQGFMSEGLSLALSYYFEQLKLHRLEANIQPENQKSIQRMKAKNFRHEGASPKYLKINGKWRDHERFAMTREDYSALL